MRLTQILRRLLQLPAFTAVSVITLAIGVGANAAVFSVVDGVLLKPLPYPQADQLIVLAPPWRRPRRSRVTCPRAAQHR